MIIKAAAIQMPCSLGDKEANLTYMERKAAELMAERPETQLILFPECAVTGYECPELFDSLAEPWPSGPSVRRLAELARRLGVYLVFGFIERSEGRLYNSAGMLGPDGKAAGCYRKVHLVEGMEQQYFTPGSTYPVFETALGKIGIMICWDSVFPEAARSLTLNGAELILVPEAVECGIEYEWNLALAARAFDNGCFVLSCNHSGTDRELVYFGRSGLYSPRGRCLSALEGDTGVLAVDIALDTLPEERDYFYMLRGRRPETYRLH